MQDPPANGDSSSHLSLVSWNANSLPAKELEFLSFCKYFSQFVASVSEARMSFLCTSPSDFVDISRSGLHVFGYPAFRQGVLIYTNVAVKVLKNYCLCLTDICVVTVKVQSIRSIVLFAYCHDGSHDVGISSLLSLYEKVCTANPTSNILIMGDLNARLPSCLGIRSNAAGRFLEPYLQARSLISHCQHVPTHKKAHLDYCISSPSNNIQVEVVQDLNSDHFPIIAKIAKIVPDPPVYFTSWKRVSEKIHQHPGWNSHLSVDDNIALMERFFRNIISKSRIQAPKRKHSLTSHHYIEFTPELVRLKNLRNRHRRYSPQWKAQDMIFQKALKHQHYLNWQKTQSEMLQDKSAGHWKLQKRLKNANSSSNRVYDYEEVATMFSSFHEVDADLEEKAEDIDETLFTRLSNLQNVHFNQVTELEIRYLLSRLPNRSSVGYDGIPYSVLKKAPKTFILWIADCCNAIMTSGNWPTSWKLALVFPLAKPSGGYRPISLLSCLSKLCERTVFSRLNQHVNNPDHRHVLQHQFAKQNGGCEKAFNTLIQQLSGTHSVAVFFDVKKAFDKVVRKRLIERLFHFDFPPYLIRVVDSFIQNRICRLKGSSVEYRPKHGVPQGSVLSGFLFQILIADLLAGALVDVDLKVLYADDMVIVFEIFKPNSNPAQISQGITCTRRRVQKTLRIIEERASSLGIDFDANKTKMMLVKPKTSRKTFNFRFKFKNLSLPFVEVYKYLGIIVDSKLTFSSCIQSKCIEARRRTDMLKRLPELGSKIRRILYLGYVQSHTFYCIRTIFPLLADQWRKKLTSAVHHGARIIATLNKWSSSPAAFVGIPTPKDYCARIPSPECPPYLQLSRAHEVPLLRYLSGSAWCNFSKYQKKLIANASCRFCDHPRETAEHLVKQCPGLASPQRARLQSLLIHKKYDKAAKHLQEWLLANNLQF